jgi:hypothetical protein
MISGAEGATAPEALRQKRQMGHFIQLDQNDQERGVRRCFHFGAPTFRGHKCVLQIPCNLLISLGLETS